ncbi:MAG: sugar transferase [Acidobacteriota bacterium]|nr:MAG: sugar transferase [Acidobacteriota bacterium]
MKAVIFCDQAGALNPFEKLLPPALLPLGDRQILQHLVELLAEGGVNEFDFIVGDHPGKLEDAMGDGTRWGAHFRYQLVKEGQPATAALRRYDPAMSGSVLIGFVNLFPIDFQFDRLRAAGGNPVVYVDSQNGEGAWAGWVSVPAHLLPELAALENPTLLGERLLSQEGTVKITSGKVCRTRDAKEFFSVQSQLLKGELPGLLLTGSEVQGGIRVARNVRIHPSANLQPPIFLGENCRVGRDVSLGPNVVVSRNCVVDEGSSLEESVVLSESYIGQGLELKDLFVLGNSFYNARLESSLALDDQFILGNIRRLGIGEKVQHLFGRLIAFVALLVTLPVLLLTGLILALFRRGPLFDRAGFLCPVGREGFARTSSSRLTSFVAKKEWTSTPGIQDLLLRVIPALWNVVKGELALVGVRPRSQDEIEQLSDQWRELILSAYPGIVTDAAINLGPKASAEEIALSDAMYAATRSFQGDLRLLWLYLLRFVGIGRV